MNTFLQGSSRLQRAYSTLRLCERSNYPRCAVAPPMMKHQFGTLTSLHVQHEACTRDDPHRRFATPAARNRRIVDERRAFMDRMKENEYAHNLFLNSIHYTKSVMHPNTTYAYVTNEEASSILEERWDDDRLVTNEEVISKLKRLSYNMRYSKERINAMLYKNFFDMLRKQCNKLSDENLKIMMQHLVPFRSYLYSCSFYQSLCEQLDKQCVARFTQLSIDDTLLLCDMVYQMIHKPNSEYIWYAMRKLGNKPNKLDCRQMVQVLFLLNVCRKPPINMYELEYHLEQYLDELSINELGISLLGFFKTGTPIRSTSVLRRIIKKTIANIDTVDSITIAAIMKLLRYSMKLTEIPLLQELLHCLIPHMPRFNLMTLVHIAHACAKVALDERELLNQIIERFNSEIKIARLKDIERLVYVFINFNIDSSNSVYQTVINELRTTWDTSRAKEISLFPQVASRILGYLAILNIYPIDLIKRVMTTEFILKTCNNNYNFLTREYCVLDYSLRVEVPEYDGPLLKPNICSMLEKKYFQEFCKTSMESSRLKLLLLEVTQTCKEIFDTTSDFSVIRPLPHYATADLIFCLDKSNRILPSKEFLSQFHLGEIIRIDKSSDDVKWIALILVHHGLLTRNTNLPIGHLVAKMRQLSKIGYTPVMVSYIHWNECKTPQQKYDYLKKLIYESKLFNA